MYGHHDRPQGEHVYLRGNIKLVGARSENKKVIKDTREMNKSLIEDNTPGSRFSISLCCFPNYCHCEAPRTNFMVQVSPEHNEDSRDRCWDARLPRWTMYFRTDTSAA